MNIITTNINLPQHNQGIVEKFVEEDMKKGPYFCFLKRVDGSIDILTNINNKEGLLIVAKEFLHNLNSYIIHVENKNEK